MVNGESRRKRSSSTSAPAKKLRVLVADEHPLFRNGLVQLINGEGDLSCCGETDSIAGTLAAVRTHKPDLLVLDLRLKDGHSLRLIKTLKAESPKLPVLVLSQHDETLYAERALRAGARGYVMKQAAVEEVRHAVRAVLNGELAVSRKVSILALHRLLENKHGSNGSGLDALSDRELEVFQLLGAGRTTGQIAAACYVSAKTIQTHRENIKHKLGLPDAAALIRHATRWVEMGHVPHPSFPIANDRCISEQKTKRRGGTPCPSSAVESNGHDLMPRVIC